MADNNPEVLLTMAKVKAQTGMGATFIYENIKEKRFPKSIRVGRRAMWVQSEVQAWIRSRIEENRGSKLDG
jgi:prophage regulatory protein